MNPALDLRAIRKNIAARVFLEMSEKGIQKEEFAKRADVSPGVIYQLRHQKGNPTLETLDKVAKALGITLGKLCDPNHRE